MTVIHLTTSVHGKYLVGKILVNHAGKRLLVRKKFGEQATVSGYGIYTFCLSVNIGEENFGE